MKTILFKQLLFLVAIGITITTFITSCEKEQESITEETATTAPAQNETVKRNSNNIDISKMVSLTSYGILSFNSRETFELTMTHLTDQDEDFLNKFENDLGFTSMRRYYQQNLPNEIRPIEDNVFATVVDQEGIIEIQNRIYKVREKEEQVFVIPDGKAEYIPLLADNRPIPGKIIETNTGNEAAYFVTHNMPSDPEPRALICKENGVTAAGKDYSNSFTSDVDQRVYKHFARVRYYKLGVYFKLYTYVEYFRDGSYYSTNIKRELWYKFKPKCWQERSSNDLWENSSFFTDKVTKTLWESSRALNKYHVKTYYEWERKDLLSTQPATYLRSDLLEIKRGY